MFRVYRQRGNPRHPRNPASSAGALLERLHVPEVLPQRILELMSGLVAVARRPHLILFFSKDPGVEVFELDDKDARVPNDNDVYLRRSALISNTDILEFTQLELSWRR